MSHREPVNIYIVGAQCTGKTTLFNALWPSFRSSHDTVSPPGIIEERARIVHKVHKFTADDIISSSDRCLQLQSLILHAQHDAETEALRDSQWIISDRSGLDPIVYAHRHLGPKTAANMMKSAAWRELRPRMEKSLIFVCEPGADWLVDDGLRLVPRDREDWDGIHRDFCQVLEQTGLRYEIVPCEMLGIGERMAFVWSKWREAMGDDRNDLINKVNRATRGDPQ
ncbi:AAA domain-containing protein [Thelonectria olida]|uniref:AAA domain-containing protein n=1 Tax=Thelonectria olida TaxID=1576542 RepID=A0A9P8W524_9HYPO|nr:AAA domain-containing protein [Thelonectria olida]